jgi:hypothetical protein
MRPQFTGGRAGATGRSLCPGKGHRDLPRATPEENGNEKAYEASWDGFWEALKRVDAGGLPGPGARDYYGAGRWALLIGWLTRARNR